MELIEALDRRRARTTKDTRLRQMKVLSLQTSPNSLTLDDRGESTPGVRYLASYSPSVGDSVWVLVDHDADLIVLGKLA